MHPRTQSLTDCRSYDSGAIELLFTAIAIFPAIALLVIVHGTVLAALFAIRLVRRKRYRANRRDQNRKQDFRIIFHGA